MAMYNKSGILFDDSIPERKYTWKTAASWRSQSTDNSRKVRKSISVCITTEHLTG